MISLSLRSTTLLSLLQAGTAQVSAQRGSSHLPACGAGRESNLPCSLQAVRAGQKALRC